MALRLCRLPDQSGSKVAARLEGLMRALSCFDTWIAGQRMWSLRLGEGSLRRRDFIQTIGSVVAWPFAARDHL